MSSNLKVWNGSDFVDPIHYRIWDGDTFVEPASIHYWDGTKFVKVWPSVFAVDTFDRPDGAVDTTLWYRICAYQATYYPYIKNQQLTIDISGITNDRSDGVVWKKPVPDNSLVTVEIDVATLTNHSRAIGAIIGANETSDHVGKVPYSGYDTFVLGVNTTGWYVTRNAMGAGDNEWEIASGAMTLPSSGKLVVIWDMVNQQASLQYAGLDLWSGALRIHTSGNQIGISITAINNYVEAFKATVATADLYDAGFTDTFEDTVLDARWVVEAGTWTVANGKAKASATDNARLKTHIPNLHNRYMIEGTVATLTSGQYDGIGVSAYYNQNDYVALYVRQSSFGVRAGGNDVIIRDHLLQLTIPFTVKIAVYDFHYRFYINDRLVYDYSLALATNSRFHWGVGIYQNGGTTQGEISEVKVTSGIPALQYFDGFDYMVGGKNLGERYWMFSSYSYGEEYPTILPTNSWTPGWSAGTGGFSNNNYTNGMVRKVDTTGNFYVSVRRSGGSGDTNSGIIIRAHETAHHYGQTGGSKALYCTVGDGKWEVYEAVTHSNVYAERTVLASGTGARPNDKYIRVEVMDELLTLYYDGVALVRNLDITDRGSGNQVGLMYSHNGTYLENLEIGDLTKNGDPWTPQLRRQRANKTGNDQVITTDGQMLNSLSSDSTYPVVLQSSSQQIQIIGEGTADVFISIRASKVSGSGTGTVSMGIYLNGVIIGTIVIPDDTVYSVRTLVLRDVELQGGDLLHVARVGSNGGNITITPLDTYIDVINSHLFTVPVRQRIIKNGDTSLNSGYSYQPIEGWIGDTTKPQTVPTTVTGHRMDVAQDGTYDIIICADVNYSIGIPQQYFVYKNGLQIGAIPIAANIGRQARYLIVKDVSLEVGDTLHLGQNGVGQFGFYTIYGTTTFLDIIQPASFAAVITQRINKNGTFSGYTNGTPVQTSDWMSDSSKSATIDTNSLRISKSGYYTIVSHVEWTQTTSNSQTWALRRNGSAGVLSSVTRAGDLSNTHTTGLYWTGWLDDGELISLWGTRANNQLNALSSTFIEAQPAVGLPRQKMTKLNNTTHYYNSNSGALLNWASDPNYPAQVITTIQTADSMRIHGSGTADLYAEIDATATIITGTNRTFTLELNGTAVASQTYNFSGGPRKFVLSATGVTVVDDDVLRVRLTAGPANGGGGTTTVTTTSFIEVIPT